MTSGQVVPGRVVSPAAISGQTPTAAFKLGQVLKEIIHAIPAAFPNENAVLAAVNDVDAFIKAFVPTSALPALATGEQRAPVEDVAKRTPPQGVSYSIPTNVPAIDYDKLAMAMVKAQMALAAETPAPAPAVVTDEDEGNG
jgi:hypothetical protein